MLTFSSFPLARRTRRVALPRRVCVEQDQEVGRGTSPTRASRTGTRRVHPKHPQQQRNKERGHCGESWLGRQYQKKSKHKRERCCLLTLQKTLNSAVSSAFWRRC